MPEAHEPLTVSLIIQPPGIIKEWQGNGRERKNKGRKNRDSIPIDSGQIDGQTTETSQNFATNATQRRKGASRLLQEHKVNIGFRQAGEPSDIVLTL